MENKQMTEDEVQEPLPEPSEGLFGSNKDFMEFSPEELDLVTL